MGGKKKKVVVRFVTGSKVNTINNLFNVPFLKLDTLQITEGTYYNITESLIREPYNNCVLT